MPKFLIQKDAHEIAHYFTAVLENPRIWWLPQLLSYQQTQLIFTVILPFFSNLNMCTLYKYTFQC